jgi:citrate synthase
MENNNKATVTLTIDGEEKTFYYDVLESTKGPNVVDMRSFYKDTGLFTYDVGLTSTASCRSEITFIDGGKGELFYRGIDIETLATKHSYLETCYLLLNKKLPNKDELRDFDVEIRYRSYLPEGLKHVMNAFPDNAHPMSTLSAGVTALAAFHFNHLELKCSDDYNVMAARIIAKVPTIAAMAYRKYIGYFFNEPNLDLSFTENFLFMMRAYPYGKMRLTADGPEKISDVEIRALDSIFTLHADHEQNASTTVVRGVGSTGSHPYVAISSGINALWGRAHGGANESVISQLEMIGDVSNVDTFIAKAKDPNDPFRLMGFGHRVYKNFDPRAKVLKKLQDELKETLNLDSKLMQIASRIEEIALNDEYFIKRNLYPNIDFYSGVILTSLRIPKEMFTCVFVIGRTVGWIAQWIEAHQDKENKIVRPRQLYQGA